MIPEIKNPFVNAKIVGENYANGDYMENVERGDPEFVMSRSQLKVFAECPARWLEGYSPSTTGAMEWGTLMDILVTSPDQFHQRVAVCPATYPVDGKKGEPPTEKPWTFAANYCKDWKLNQDDKLIVKHEEYNDAKHAMGVLFDDKECAELIRESDKQVMVTAEYHDKETKLVVPVKCLIDLVPFLTGPFRKSLCDFKTSTSAAHHAFVRQCFDCGWHWQAAMYLDVYTAATGEDRLDFRHIVQESYHPFQVSKELMSAEYIDLGRIGYIEALKRYCQCLATGVWPGYSAQTQIDGWNLNEPLPWMVLA